MADILEFRASSEQAPKPRTRRRRRTAEIVIFPGVRYERWTDGPQDSGGKPVKRDVLELAD